MPVLGNERVANAVPPFEEGSESNLRVLFFFLNYGVKDLFQRSSTLGRKAEHNVEATR